MKTEIICSRCEEKVECTKVEEGLVSATCLSCGASDSFTEEDVNWVERHFNKFRLPRGISGKIDTSKNSKFSVRTHIP